MSSAHKHTHLRHIIITFQNPGDKDLKSKQQQKKSHIKGLGIEMELDMTTVTLQRDMAGGLQNSEEN